MTAFCDTHFFLEKFKDGYSGDREGEIRERYFALTQKPLIAVYEGRVTGISRQSGRIVRRRRAEETEKMQEMSDQTELNDRLKELLTEQR